MSTSTMQPKTASSETNHDAASQLVPVEEILQRAFAAMRERQADAAGGDHSDFPDNWVAESLERRPLRLVATVEADKTNVWLLDPGHGAEVGLHVNVYHPADREHEPSRDLTWAYAVVHTKAFTDLLDVIDWVAKDTTLVPQL